MNFRQVRAGVVFLSCTMALIGQQQSDPNKFQDLTLPLFPQGFAETSVTIPAGKYLINVLNRSGVRGINLEIDRLAGSTADSAVQTHEANGSEDLPRGRFIKPVNLASGTYRVRVTSRPGWVCLITVK